MSITSKSCKTYLRLSSQLIRYYQITEEWNFWHSFLQE